MLSVSRDVKKNVSYTFLSQAKIVIFWKRQEKYCYMFYDYTAEEKTLLISKSNYPVTYLIFVASVRPRHPFNL